MAETPEPPKSTQLSDNQFEILREASQQSGGEKQGENQEHEKFAGRVTKLESDAEHSRRYNSLLWSFVVLTVTLLFIFFSAYAHLDNKITSRDARIENKIEKLEGKIASESKETLNRFQNLNNRIDALILNSKLGEGNNSQE